MSATSAAISITQLIVIANKFTAFSFAAAEVSSSLLSSSSRSEDLAGSSVSETVALDDFSAAVDGSLLKCLIIKSEEFWYQMAKATNRAIEEFFVLDGAFFISS